MEIDAKVFMGRIYTSFNPIKRVESIVVLNGYVIYAGSIDGAEAICRYIPCKEIDLGKRVALPGFIDAHLHLDGLGLALNTLDLRDVKSIAELKERLRAFAKDRKGWILGRGWDQEVFAEGRYPTRWDLDEVVPDKPVLLVRVCGHLGVVNSYAMKMLRLEDVFKENPNLVKENGVPNGIVREDVLAYVRSSIEFSEDEIEKHILDAQHHLLANGVTCIGFVSTSIKVLPILFRLWSEDKLRVRMRLYLEPKALDLVEALGIRGGFGNSIIRVNGIKLFVDGSLGARTAWLSKPYADDPTTSGTQMISLEELISYAKRCISLGMQMAIHAIGDRALDLVLKLFESIGYENTDRYRFRVEHASVVRDDQLDKLAESRVVAVVQPHFIITDWWVVKRVGIHRAKWVYRFRSMLSRGIRLAFSTDSPVEPCNPWETIYAAITRGEEEGIELAKHTPDEKLDIATSLALYTEGSAYALRDSDIGKLEQGYLADIAVVDRDPLEIDDPREIRKVKNLETYVAGEKVFP